MSPPTIAGTVAVTVKTCPASSLTGSIDFAQFPQQRGKLDRREIGAAGAALDLGDAQQGGEQRQDIVGRGDGPFQRLVVIACAGGFGARPLKPVAQMGDRGAQVMGDVVGDLAQILHQAGNAVQHVVDGFRQAVEFVAGAAHRNAGRQIAVHDSAGRRG